MNKVVFFTTIRGDNDFFPIRKAASHKFEWEARAKMELSNLETDALRRPTHYAKCPSFPIAKSLGVLVYLPFDINIQIHDNGNVEWNAPGTLKIVDGLDVQVIEWHSKHNIKESYSILGDGVFKINTSWIAAATNPNIKLLILPVMTPDQDIFTASGGVLDIAKNAGYINIQGYLRGNFKNYTLRAGTPIAQVIPLTDKPVDIEIRHDNKNDKELAESVTYLAGRSMPRNESKKLVARAVNKWAKVETGTTNVLRRKANNIYRNTKNWLQKRGDSVS